MRADKRFTGMSREIGLSVFFLLATFTMATSPVAAQSLKTARTIQPNGAVATASPLVVSGLVGQWKCDEGAGGIAADSSGNNFNGTLLNSPVWTAGKTGGALQFNRTNRVTVPDNDAFSFGTGAADRPFSVALWVNFSDASEGNFVGHFLAPSNREWRFGRVVNSSSIYLILFDDVAKAQISRATSQSFTPGTWYHLAATYDGSRNGNGVKFYIAGVATAQSANADTPGYVAMRNTATPLEIAGFNGSPSFSGKLDDVRLYNRVLSPSEILTVYNEAAQGSTPPVISSISATNLTTSSVTINWVTDKPADSQVEFISPCPVAGCLTPLVATLSTTHAIDVASLTSGTAHTYRVRSKDSESNLAVSSNQIFTTLAVAPVISSISATNIMTSSVTINWVTDKPADSQVEFISPCPAAGCLTTLVGTLSTTHAIDIANLESGTGYTYRVRSKDSGGNLAISTNQTFTTAAPPLSGLVGQWKFDEVLGVVAADSSGNNFNGTLLNSPVWTAGKAGGALQFNRTNRVTVPDNDAFSFGTGAADRPFSVALWVNFSDASEGNFIGHFLAPSNREWRFGRVVNSSSIYLILFDDVAKAQISRATSQSFTPGTWYHLAATYDGSRNGNGVKFYIAGVATAQSANADTPGYVAMRNTATPLEIAGFNGGPSFSGKLDDVRLYNRALSPSEVLAVYNEGAGGPTPPVISSISATNITTSSVTINWITDKPADSQVEFISPCPVAGCLTPLVATLSTTHAIDVANLTSGTAYTYRVRSKDSESSLAISSNQMFTTVAVAPPVISSISATNITTSSVTINWMTDRAADSQVEFISPCPAAGCLTTLVGTLSTTHAIDIANLESGAGYTYRVRSKDSGGNLAISTNQTITTAAPPLSGLVGQWKFDEILGAVAADSSGNNFNGTLLNSPVWTAGKAGDALQFNRTNRVTVPDNDAFSFGTGAADRPFSVALWVNFSDASEGNFIGHFLAPSNREWRFGRVVNSSSIYLILFDDVAKAQISRATSQSFTPGTWYHLAATYDGSRSGSGMKFYIAGVATAQSANADTFGYVAMRNTATPLEIAGFNGGPSFSGKLDDVRLYNRVLSPSEILAVYNEAAQGSTPPVISSISATNLTTSSATINWVTDRPADSQVDYGTTTAYGASSTLDSTLVLTHSQTLTNLTAGTAYHYRVRSRDASGTAGTSGDLTFTTAGTGELTTFFVAPNGNDNNSGTIDAPFLTIPRAQAAVRLHNTVMTSDITVYLRQGTYPISSTLDFGAQDSGFNGHNVIYTSYPNERATITGGQTITGWSAVGNGIYRANAPLLNFRQLYINGVPGVRARTPNAGNYNRMVVWQNNGKIGVRMDNGADIYDLRPIVRSEDIVRWPHLDEVEFIINLEWCHLVFHVADFTDTADGNKLIIPKEPAIVNGGHSVHKMLPPLGNAPANQPYYFENAKEFLDALGEWYLDQHEGALYYKPRFVGELDTAVVTAPVVERLLQVEGDSSDSLARNIQFWGLTFENSNWTSPSSIGFFNTQGDTRQMGVDLSVLAPIPGAVYIKNAKSLRFERNIFQNLGGTGMLLYSGVSNSDFIGNVFQDIAASGMALEARYSEPGFIPNYFRVPLTNVDPRTVIQNNVVKNNYFNRIARDYSGSQGIFATYIQGLTIEHNEFYDMPQDGISVGTAGWRYWEETPVRNNVTRYNRIHNVMNLVTDGAGVYVMGNQPNSSIVENYVYDLMKSPWAGANPVAGIYLDSRTGNYTVTNNIMENIRRSDGAVDLTWAHFVNIEAFDNIFYNPTTPVLNWGDRTTFIYDGNINPTAIKAAAGIEPDYQNIVIP